MSYQQYIPPYTNQAILGQFQPDPNYIQTLPYNGYYDPALYFLNSQTLVGSVYTPYDAGSLRLDGSEWLLENVAPDYLVSATEEQLLDLQSAIGERSIGLEHSTENQDLGQVIARLESKCDRLEEAIEKLENEIDGKTKFVVKVEEYINKLVAWTIEFNQAAEGLAEDIEEIKEAINLRKS
ncbi:MAG: hypothetical protein M1839_009413 [Geoglossum umbratile]|nr:MAG: hypothetical protein M1839_009413 [Geoglossum umbratile]